jgi:hypothetical protein
LGSLPSFFFFCYGPIKLAHCNQKKKKKKVDLVRHPQLIDMKQNMGRTLCKPYGITTRCYWKHPWGTHWEPREDIRNVMGAHWELEREHVGNKGKLSQILLSRFRGLGFLQALAQLQPDESSG